jgi:hypothetical protein
VIRIAMLGLLLAGCAVAPHAAIPSPTPAAVSIFVVAHQDDWQLFMSASAFHAMDQPDKKAVFVHVTAGDAGLGVSGAPVSYYKAREEGALRAIRFLSNVGENPGHGARMEWRMVDRAGHRVQRVAYANAVAYFLRLPDGNGFKGTGYESTGFQSLERLKNGDIKSIQAVDGSARYRGWGDLQTALQAIIEAEDEAGKPLSIHIMEPDAALNPEEHSDHRHTALAIQGVLPGIPCASLHLYDTYDNRNRPQNLSGEELLIAVGLWGATTSGLADNYAKSTWDSIHTGWLGRLYSRTSTPQGKCQSPG